MRLIIFVLISFILTGCTMPVRFYLRNTTKEEIKIRARLMNIESYETISYDSKIYDINFKLNKLLQKRLAPIKEKGRSLYFILPPESTFFIGHGANFKNFTFDEIVIIRNDKEYLILNWENTGLLERGKSFPNKCYAWYDIK